MQTHLEAAFARRGTRETGGAVERALRIVGWHVDSLKSFDIMVTEQDGDWLLRCADPAAGKHQLIEFLGSDLVQLGEEAVADRRR